MEQSEINQRHAQQCFIDLDLQDGEAVPYALTVAGDVAGAARGRPSLEPLGDPREPVVPARGRNRGRGDEHLTESGIVKGNHGGGRLGLRGMICTGSVTT